jgi:hypothetical protein
VEDAKNICRDLGGLVISEIPGVVADTLAALVRSTALHMLYNLVEERGSEGASEELSAVSAVSQELESAISPADDGTGLLKYCKADDEQTTIVLG